MITTEIVLVIAGAPAPKGSMKCIGQRGPIRHVVIDSNKDVDGWLDEITRWAKKVRQTADVGQPLVVEATVTIARPKDHYRTGAHAGELKPWAYDRWPVGHTTGDVDKHVRSLLDGLQKAPVLPDDCQVVEVTGRKAYVEATNIPDALEYPGAVIRIYPAQEG